MSRKRGRQHLKTWHGRRTFVVRRGRLVELQEGDAIRGGTILFDGPDGRIYVFADYLNNAQYCRDHGLDQGECDHVEQFRL